MNVVATTPVGDGVAAVAAGGLMRSDREARLRQRGAAVWAFGLSGAGKSTLMSALARALHERGFCTVELDGDALRAGLNRGLGFSDADRTENVRRAAEVARLLVDAGVVVLCSFITPLRAQRDLARAIVGEGDFLGVHVAARYETCAARDPKGHYAAAASGRLAGFTGRDSAFESPERGEPVLIVDTERLAVDAALGWLLAEVLPRVERAQFSPR